MSHPFLLVTLTFGLAFTTSACASSPSPLRLKASDPSTFARAAPGQPIILEFAEGDVVPLSVIVEGQLFETRSPSPPVLLVAKRRFFVKMDGDSLRTSLDGERWGGSRRRGSVSLGLDMQPSGTSARVRFVTPTHDP